MADNGMEYSNHQHRRRYGQFFTPPALARFMVAWVRQSGRKGVFDPAFGLGAFREPMQAADWQHFSAMEIDSGIVDLWAREHGGDKAFIQIGDYLRAWGHAHDNIVCNPPYLRFQRFLNRDAVCHDFYRHLGVDLSGYTNVASAFLLKSLAELRPGGRLAYLMPLEFLNTGYGKLVKRCLLEARHLFAVVSLGCEKEVFPDAVTSVGMVLVDKSRQHDTVKFYSCASLDELDGLPGAPPVSEVNCKQLDPNGKWLPLFQRQAVKVCEGATTKLSFYGRFRRGIATGANEFFSMPQSRMQGLGLAEGRDCVPCITRSAQIASPFFSSQDFDSLRRQDKPVFLFSVDSEHSAAAHEYIKAGECRGYHQRFIPRHRRPWYRLDARAPAQLLLGVFSRGGYKIVRNASQAVNLTCYHGFVPNLFGLDYLEHLFLYLASRAGREVVSLVSRKYGDSLDKFEPNDINDALVPTQRFFESMPGGRIEEALAEFKSKGQVPDWVERKFLEIRMAAAPE